MKYAPVPTSETNGNIATVETAGMHAISNNVVGQYLMFGNNV